MIVCLVFSPDQLVEVAHHNQDIRTYVDSGFNFQKMDTDTSAPMIAATPGEKKCLMAIGAYIFPRTISASSM